MDEFITWFNTFGLPILGLVAVYFGGWFSKAIKDKQITKEEVKEFFVGLIETIIGFFKKE